MIKTPGNKSGRQFRLGCTSYSIPDHLVPNVKRMASLVDDIELLCFEAPDRSYYIDEAVVKELLALKENHALSYTVHCPTDFKAGAPGEWERQKFCEAFLAVYHLTSPLEPEGFVLHLEGLTSKPSVAEQSDWTKRVMRVCETIAGAIPRGAVPAMCLENLGYDPAIVAAIADTFGFSLCIDVGHLWIGNYDWREYCEQMLHKTKIIHLHGVAGLEDHLSLSRHNDDRLTIFLREILPQYRGILTLEVFSEQDVIESIERVGGVWEQ